MTKFAPIALIVLILTFWIGNSSRHAKRAKELDREILELSKALPSGTDSNRRSPQEIPKEQSGPPGLKTLSEIRLSIQTLLDEASQSSEQDQFGFQLRTTLQVLRLAQELSTDEFIALVDQLDFPGGPGFYAQLTMMRIGFSEAPERLLINPPSDLWKDPNFQIVGFSKLVEINPDLSREWLEENESRIPENSRDIFHLELLKHDLNSDPHGTLSAMTDNDFLKFSYLFRIEDYEERERIAKATFETFPENTDRKMTILSGLLIGAFQSKESDPAELVRHLDTFFPDDPDGQHRSKALGGILGYFRGDLTKDKIEEALTVARSISPASEHEMIRASASKWAGSNLEEASSWLDSMPESALRDSAVTGFISKISAANPQVALEWAATMQDRAIADKQVEGILQRWESKDPAAVEMWRAENR